MWKFENTSYAISTSLHDSMQRPLILDAKMCFESKDQKGVGTLSFLKISQWKHNENMIEWVSHMKSFAKLIFIIDIVDFP